MALSREEISETTRKDATLQEVTRLISTGQRDNLKIFATIRRELTSVDGNLVLRGSCIVVPDALQKQVVELAHEGHQGLVKTCGLLGSKLWFPRMDSLVDFCGEMLCSLSSCHDQAFAWTSSCRWLLCQCSMVTSKNWFLWSCWTLCPCCHWQLLKISRDWGHPLYFCQSGDSKAWPHICCLWSSPSHKVVSSHNLLRILASSTVSPLWSEANGEVERFMKKFGKVLRTTTWTGSKICIRSYTIIVLLPIVLQVLPLLQPCLEGQSESSNPILLLCQVVKVITLWPCTEEMLSRNSGSKAPPCRKFA